MSEKRHTEDPEVKFYFRSNITPKELTESRLGVRIKIRVRVRVRVDPS